MKSQKQTHILVVGRIFEEEDVFNLTVLIINKFNSFGQCNVYTLEQSTCQKVAKYLPEIKCKVYKNHLHEKFLSFVITIGGDGTILYAAKQLFHSSPPFLAFQRGTLGFMCRFLPIQAEEVVQLAIESLQKHQGQKNFPFQVNRIMRIESLKKSKINGTHQGSKLCVNEVLISRQKCQRIILQIWVNKQFLTETAGDGILISTPTGSTAYSLSAGGPIMQNGVNGILIVPIAPNSLSFRPICISSSSQIVLRIAQKSRGYAYISYDGQKNQSFTIEHQIIIRKAQFDLKFYEPTQQMSIQLPTWIKRLKRFLGWNQSFKNPTLISQNSFSQKRGKSN